MAEEIELKLLATPAELERIARHPVIRSLKIGRGRSQHLNGTYFDTPELALRDKRMALRVRQEGGVKVQTLKVPAGRPGEAAHHYIEHSCVVSDGTPDLARVEDEALVQSFAQEDVQARLAPVFSTDVARRTYRVEMIDSEVELALDRGEITGNGKAVEISEAELELVSGKPARLYELALQLIESVPFTLGLETKAKRGFKLLKADPAKALHAAPVALTPEMTAEVAFDLMVRACFDQMRGNEAVVLGRSEPEGVHQLRVGVRRLRAIISLYKPWLSAPVAARLSEELRWLQQALGGARDHDVFLLETLGPLDKALDKREPAMMLLREKLQQQREAAYDEAAESITSPRYTRLLLYLGLWSEEHAWLRPPEPGEARHPRHTSIKDFATAALDKRARKLLKLGRRHKKLALEELHEVRIAAKKLRYPVDFFRCLYSAKAVKPYRQGLLTLQDSLGHLNDSVVGRRLVQSAFSDSPDPTPQERVLQAKAQGLVTGWQAATAQAGLSHFAEFWKAHKQAKPFWSGK